jgi:hypothetical protein
MTSYLHKLDRFIYKYRLGFGWMLLGVFVIIILISTPNSDLKNIPWIAGITGFFSIVSFLLAKFPSHEMTYDDEISIKKLMYKSMRILCINKSSDPNQTFSKSVRSLFTDSNVIHVDG